MGIHGEIATATHLNSLTFGSGDGSVLLHGSAPSTCSTSSSTSHLLLHGLNSTEETLTTILTTDSSGLLTNGLESLDGSPPFSTSSLVSHSSPVTGMMTTGWAPRTWTKPLESLMASESSSIKLLVRSSTTSSDQVPPSLQSSTSIIVVDRAFGRETSGNTLTSMLSTSISTSLMLMAVASESVSSQSL